MRRTIIARRGRATATAAAALAALILYPFAILLPIVEIERFGRSHSASVIEGVSSLIADGQLVVAVVVFLCSIVFPLGKLLALLVLSTGAPALRHSHRAWTYLPWRLIEWTGRWGMLDVLLVAIMVAVLKLGNVVEVTAGPAALAFTCCVVLSLIAAACFDPHARWETR